MKPLQLEDMLTGYLGLQLRIVDQTVLDFVWEFKNPVFVIAEMQSNTISKESISTHNLKSITVFHT